MDIKSDLRYYVLRTAILEDLRNMPHYANAGVSLSDIATDAAYSAVKALLEFERNR